MNSDYKWNWKDVIFDEIVEDSAFGPRFSGDAYDENGNIATLRTTDIFEDGKISYETMPLAKLDETSFSKHFLRTDDLVITRSGRVGTTALFGIYHLPVLPGAFLIRFRLSNKAYPKFFRYWFNSRIGQQRLLSVSRGAAQQNINITNVKKIKVPLPPLPIQKRIASILSAYDDLIENNRRRIQLLEQAARMLYKEWFVRLRFPGHEHVKIVDGLPEGWERKKVPELIKINPKVSKTNGTTIRYIPMSGLSTSGMSVNLQDSEYRDKSTSVRFRNGDTLFARITPCLENGKTGFVNFLHEDEIACGSTEFIVMRGFAVSQYFTYCLARTHDFREIAIKSMIGSSGRQRVQPSCFNDFHVALPSKILLKQFDEYCDSIFCQIESLSRQALKLNQARDLLLPRLMNGEMAV
ncbi:MAG: restriction endonuclease subunit S [Candidatus Omnitrophica bacterium]|nr:restriction endonuclease subunit S [Candidatus Omnitrophota bacterium]